MVKGSLIEAVHSGLLKSKMDTNVMFENLLDHNAAKRVEILIVMRKLLKNGNGYLPFQNTSLESVFSVLFHVLDDTRWEVRYQCLLLMCGIIPNINDELDSCMSLVLPKIISNLGHDNVNVRRAALQSLHIFMKHTNNLQNFQKIFIHYGLENPEFIVRKGCIMSIGILFASGFENENLFPLIECLSKQFVDGDASLFYPIFLAMQKIHELLGSATFDQYLQKLDEEASNTYMRVLNKFSLHGSRMSSSSGSHSSFSNINGLCGGGNKLLKYDFGIFQPYITEKIKSDDWKTRVEAIEHMKMIISEVPDFSEKISDMDEYMVFLSKLLDDSNFKIVIQALSVYDLLIDKFKNQIRRFLKTFVTSVLKRLGDTKLVVREHAIRVIHRLMHHVKPTEVLGHLLHHRDNRNQRLREEIVNRVTAAVLTFPSYNFEFLPLCESVAPLLTDTKRRVRLAALECFAALAQAMGPMRLVPLVTAVDEVEINSDAEGLLAAVQARLARRILPRCTEDGAVSYAIILPSSACSQNRNVSSWGPDIEWIMAASSSSSSSTPPSRSKDICVTDLDQNGEAATCKVVDIKEPRNEELVNVFKRDSNWLKNTPYDASASVSQHAENELVKEQNRRLNIEIKDDKVKPIVTTSIEKSTNGSSDGSSTGEGKCYQDGSRMRPVIVNSKIPVLARASGKKFSAEETTHIKAPPLRALSAQRHNTLPSFSVRHSAVQRRGSNYFPQENKVPNIIQMEKNSGEPVLPYPYQT